MKIAHVGLKGIPAKFGGIESFVEEVSSELVRRKHEVVVYSRRWYSKYDGDKYRGITIRYTPSVNIRLIDSLIHGLTSTFDIIKDEFDVVHFHGNVSFLYIPLIRLLKRKIRTVITFHGQLWTPDKYNFVEKLMLKLFTDIGVLFSHEATSVSPDIKEIYTDKMIHHTPIGMMENEQPGVDLIGRRDLQTEEYILFLGVLEKNKRVDWIIKAYNKLNTDVKLVIAGDTPDREFSARLRKLAGNNNNIIFTGFVNGQLKSELIANCRLFILPSDTEGMPVAIVEAVGYGRPCLVRNILSFQYLFEDGVTGFFCDNEKSLCEMMGRLLRMDVKDLMQIGMNARDKLLQKYSYSKTVDTFEMVYKGIRT